MATDVFNNPSNDYVNPGLSPCVNVADGNSGNFEFIDGGAGVVSGANILQFLDLSDISIPVSAWTGQNITLQSGEVTYVPGLTKGLQQLTQVFPIPDFGYTNQEYFLVLDLSINFYKNFKHYEPNVNGTGDYDTNVTIADSLNIALGNAGIYITATYDASGFTFTGNTEGYNFDVTNAVLTVIDASMNANSPFPHDVFDGWSEVLIEDATQYIPSAKYPNGAMLGYVVKPNYPTGECQYACWIYMNHVKNPFEYYLPVTVINTITDISTYETTTFDPSVQWGPFVDDVSVSVKDVSCVDTVYTYDPSYGLPITYSALVDNSILTYAFYGESVITNSIIEYSGIFDFRIAEASLYRIEDSSIYGSDLYDNNVGAITPESYTVNCFISDSSLTQVDVSGGFIQKSYVRLSLIENADVVCLELIEDSSVFKSTIKNLYSSGNDFYESGIENVTLISHGIYDSSVLDSSIVSSTVRTTFIENSDISVGNISDSYLKNTVLFNSYIIDSSIIDSPIQRDTSIYSSVIQNSWLNAYIFLPGIWTDDASPGTIEIHGSTILDTSIFNTTVYDSVIYTSDIYDSSLIRCSIYNSHIPDSVTVTDSSLFEVNATCDGSISWTEDTSTLYQQYSQTVDVGAVKGIDSRFIGASDYLHYITEHDMWFKVGPFASRFTTPDHPTVYTENLIPGFYLYNPQTFPVQVEYMVLNYEA